MGRFFTLIFVFASLVAAVPHYFQRYQETHSVETAATDGPSTDKMFASELRPSRSPAMGTQTVSLQADDTGHFNGHFSVNGRNVEGMIDTGATFVALNVDTARRLGVKPKSADFKYAVRTANGETMAAYTKLTRVEIGGIRVYDVEAFVLENEALTSTLVGMSFLKKLKSFQVEHGVMELVN